MAFTTNIIVRVLSRPKRAVCQENHVKVGLKKRGKLIRNLNNFRVAGTPIKLSDR